jgi:beta-phosphoglucomutase family hydrolase
MFKAVIFDMDGVIIDSEPTHFKLEQKLFKELGVNITKEKHNGYVGTTSYYMWDDIRTKHGITKDLEELVRNDRESYYKHLVSNENEVILVNGVKEFIKELHKNNLKLAIASSSPLDVIEAVARIFNIEEYFDVLVTGDNVEKSKPEPDIFLYAAEKLGTTPENCIVVEDSHNGVLAAKKAGMKCVGYINPASGNQDIYIADLVADRFSKLNFEKLNNLFKE